MHINKELIYKLGLKEIESQIERQLLEISLDRELSIRGNAKALKLDRTILVRKLHQHKLKCKNHKNIKSKEI